MKHMSLSIQRIFLFDMVEVWNAVVVQDHDNQRHKFLIDRQGKRFEDINELSEYLVDQYNLRGWVKN